MQVPERILYLTASFDPELPRECKSAPYPHETKFLCYTEEARTGWHSGWRFCHFSASEKQQLKEHVWSKGSTRPNVLKARFVKTQFCRLAEVVAYAPTVVCWIDGNMQIVSDNFCQLFLPLLADNLIVTYPHNFLAHAHDDVRSVRNDTPHMVKRYATEPVQQQIDVYTADGYTEEVSNAHGYICTGIVAVRPYYNTPQAASVTQMMDAWWQEILTWSIHDQVGLAYSLWKRDVKHGMICDGKITGSDGHWYWHHV